ncbi:hypothetical protein J28TS4_57240 [Paenibacillus lautus]|nr:hypothetical protein J28TS4_57240 [Paenibacillus lautus]
MVVLSFGFAIVNNGAMLTLKWIRRGISLGKEPTKSPNKKEPHFMVNRITHSDSIEHAHAVGGSVP